MSHRHFLAVQPDGLSERAEVKQLLMKLKRTLQSREREVKWVRPELWHVTVRFLGPLVDAEVERVRAALGGWRPPSGLVLRVGGLGAFPEALAARVLWLGVQASGELHRLHDDLGARLGLGADPQGFVPHVTLARLRHTSSVSDLLELGGRGHRHFGDYPVRSVVLFKSEGLGPHVRYTPVEEYVAR